MTVLPEVDGWGLRRLKHVATLRFSNVDKLSNDDEVPVSLCNYTDVYKNDFITPGLEFMQATASRAEIERFQLRAGDVIITKDSETADDIAVPAYVANELPGVLCGYHLAIVRPAKPTTNGQFLFRALQASGIREQFWVAANGVTRFGLGQQAIGNVLVPHPPATKQQAIADFLDRKTAAIDALIAKKERLIELLEEKRQALITQAVTKGLDRKVPMKDSGIEWLGEIPAHWEVLPLRRVVARFCDYRGRTPKMTPNGVPLITASAIRDGVIDHSRDPEYVSEDTYRTWCSRGSPEQGDVVFTTEGATYGETAQVEDAHIAFSQRLILFKCNRGIMTNDYLYFQFLSAFGRAEQWRMVSGSTVPGIRADRLRRIRVVVPPVGEQDSIAAYCRAGLSALKATGTPLARSVQLLREYRQALISAAVTGKIDLTKERAA